jgi:hypothetical protein
MWGGFDCVPYLRSRQAPRQNRNAPRRTRTFDPLIKSQLLYQLS